MDLRRLNLIALVIVALIAVISIVGSVASSFIILKAPVTYVKYPSFVGLNLISARIVTFAGAFLILISLILILLTSFKHRGDNAPWTSFFLKRDKSKRFIREIEVSLILGLLATVVFAVNATILSFLEYGLVIAFWILAIMIVVIAVFSVDLFMTYFRRFI